MNNSLVLNNPNTKLSIVATLYNSSPYFEEFYKRITDVAKSLFNKDYEVILVDDGSSDNSLSLAKDTIKNSRNTKVLELSRNFGHHQAMYAGLKESKGDFIFLIDSDLEEQPEWLYEFKRKMESENADVIFGQQIQRKGSFSEKITGWAWYKILNLVTGISHPENITTARLMNRNYLNAFLQFGEKELVISCIWLITGFKQISHPVDKKWKRSSSYSFPKKVSHCFNALTSFSERPLYYTFILGLIISLSSFIFTLYLVANKILFDNSLDGWVSIMSSIWLICGLLISCIGLIGIYIAKTFIETKNRPLFLIKHIHNGKQ
jgi:putative glycosyltransferase